MHVCTYKCRWFYFVFFFLERMYKCVRLYENAYINAYMNACEIETLAMLRGSQTTFFEKKCENVTLVMLRWSRTAFWKDAWNFEFLLHENFENAYMKIFRVHECVKFLSLYILIHEIIGENALMNAWKFWICIYWYMKLLIFFIRVHGWMHETPFFSFTFCLNENAFMNAWDFVFHFRMKMRFYSSFLMHVKSMYQTLWKACKNAWDFILIIFFMRMHVQMHETLFWSFFDENGCKMHETLFWSFFL